MDSLPNNLSIEKGEIRFPNDNRAVFVKASLNEATADLLKALELKKPATILLLIGGADELDPALNTQIEHLLEHGLAAAAADTNALIIDGGTKAGVMGLIGKAIALRGRVTPLLGIAPEGKVTYPGGPEEGSIAEGAALDPNHSHFILVQGAEWSGGTDLMFKLVAELATEARVVVVLINGGDEARDEVQRAGKLGWPVVVIQGSGRQADKIARQVTFANEGNFEVFSLKEKPGDLRQLLIRHGQGALLAESALFEARRRLAQYDVAANTHQARHRRLLSFTLAIGILGTLFALAQKQFTRLEGGTFIVTAAGSLFIAMPILLMGGVSFLKIFRPKNDRTFGIYWVIAGSVSVILALLAWTLGVTRFLTYAVLAFKYLAIAVPVIVSIMLTASNQFKNRRKWILLRGSAEAIKKEMFRYRTKVGDYAERDKSNEGSKEAESKPRSRDVVLAEHIVTITQRLMRTEVNTGSLQYKGPVPPADTAPDSDDYGPSFLTSERYLQVRLEHQLSYYEGRVAKYERQRSELQWLIFIVGGLGTLLAALGAQLWIALTTATVTALSAWVGDLRLDLTLVKFNQTAAALSDLRVWWRTLSPDEKAKPDNHEALVNQTEQILENERSDWVMQMDEKKEEDPEPASPKKKQK
jgi:hypothetical protein